MEHSMRSQGFPYYTNWAARIIMILFAALLSIFSADFYSKDFSFWQNAFSLFMHLVPVFILLGTAWASWKRQWIGALVCLILAVLYIIWAWGRFPLSVYFLIDGPLLVLSILYFISWLGRKV